MILLTINQFLSDWLTRVFKLKRFKGEGERNRVFGAFILVKKESSFNPFPHKLKP